VPEVSSHDVQRHSAAYRLSAGATFSWLPALAEQQARVAVFCGAWWPQQALASWQQSLPSMQQAGVFAQQALSAWQQAVPGWQQPSFAGAWQQALFWPQQASFCSQQVLSPVAAAPTVAANNPPMANSPAAAK
jgi:hypothetical protein